MTNGIMCTCDGKHDSIYENKFELNVSVDMSVNLKRSTQDGKPFRSFFPKVLSDSLRNCVTIKTDCTPADNIHNISSS